MGNAMNTVCKCKGLLNGKPVKENCKTSKSSLSPEVVQTSKRKVYKDKYLQLGKLGEGGFSKVYLVSNIKTGQQYALKKVSKSRMSSGSNQVTLNNIMTEKAILQKVSHPFIVKFSSCFQDCKNLYYVTEYCRGGSIQKYLSRVGFFSEKTSVFYTCEILLALKAMHHEYRVIYRDLKPENCLVGDDGHVKLTDFGLSTIGKKFSITGCGTPEFMAPEILKSQPHNRMVDYWSLGCLLFLFLYGRHPFYDRDLQSLFSKIKAGKFTFPETPFVSEEIKELIKGLLKVNVSKRLGFRGIEEIFEARCFSGVNWNDIYNKRQSAPIKVEEETLAEERDVEESLKIGQQIVGFTYDTPEFANMSYNPIKQ